MHAHHQGRNRPLPPPPPTVGPPSAPVPPFPPPRPLSPAPSAQLAIRIDPELGPQLRHLWAQRTWDVPWLGIAVLATAAAKAVPLMLATVVVAALTAFGGSNDGLPLEDFEIEAFERSMLIALGVILVGVIALLVSLMSFRLRWRLPFIAVSTLMAIGDGVLLVDATVGSGTVGPPDSIVGVVLLAQIAIAVQAWRLPRAARVGPA